MRIGLFGLLLLDGAAIFFSIWWISDRIQNRLGLEIAEVVVAIQMVLIMILVLFGFWAGFRVDRILRLQKIQRLWMYRLMKHCKVMRSLWHYIQSKRVSEDTRQPAPESISVPEHAPRRGRRPTHSLKRWIQVVKAWEDRDPRENTMTLSEYLGEQFGIYADGSPKMSQNSYYAWKKKVLRELQMRKIAKKDEINS